VEHHEVTLDYLGGGIATLMTLGELRQQLAAEGAA
jgi:hypothetical protein